ncbi:DNase I-like protein [Dacryopinax primogenitus]|uniref:DNA-(apurinic or apyrimidinic site) endonuclease n=1 Tax=Dacryopinax primogenitus (strain DJM 731) TaxID=1858805 RepID=M5G469_DACPD|nr:DNase I-like protein [Dacryopinax primogenitus]EJU03010.1 DNase I-like protein [Dacryopinax primogenitus]
MRILTWNVNGIRTLPQYYPWSQLKTLEAILAHPDIRSDIYCFQEMKIMRPQIDRDKALPGSYDSFISLPTGKGGYSGVAIYVDSNKAKPIKAEEGLSGLIQPNPPLSEEDRVSSTYPAGHLMDFIPDEDDRLPSGLLELDNEGRALILDLGLFVLINVYCPADTVKDRFSYKFNFHRLLQERVRLLQEENCEVIIVGDLNMCASRMDDGEPVPESKKRNWNEEPWDWLKKWVQPNGRLVDVTRRFHPDRTKMYTFWESKKDGRTANFGLRLDYILCTEGLLPWLKGSDILPQVLGSDHCPVYVDLHDEIILEDGTKKCLRDEMKQTEITPWPRFATRFWPELSGKQTKISSFFVTKPADGDRPPKKMRAR